MSVKMRQEVERKIVGQFVADALAAGYRLSVSLERGFDRETMLTGSRDATAILSEAFAGDECHIFVHLPVGPLRDKHRRLDCVGWVYLVYGNSGYDVISDYTTNLEELLKPANALADSYA